MVLELAALTPDQLRIYAAGYSDALAESGPEQAMLGEYVRQVAGRLAQLEAENDRPYHQAYCNRHEPAARRRPHAGY